MKSIQFGRLFLPVRRDTMGHCHGEAPEFHSKRAIHAGFTFGCFLAYWLWCGWLTCSLQKAGQGLVFQCFPACKFIPLQTKSKPFHNLFCLPKTILILLLGLRMMTSSFHLAFTFWFVLDKLMQTKSKSISISTHSFTSALFQIRFFNIFHPLDPVAYRVEPLLMPHLANEPPAQTGSVGEDADAVGPPLRMDWVLPSASMNSAAQLLQEGMAGGWQGLKQVGGVTKSLKL